MKDKTEQKRTAVAYTFDRNGALVVNPYSLLTNGIVRNQISAAIKFGRVFKERSSNKERARTLTSTDRVLRSR